MSDFDKLLNEVLHQEVNPIPSSALKARIFGMLPLETRRSQIRRKAWTRVAATISIGLAACILVRIRVAFLIRTPSERVSLTRLHNSSEKTESDKVKMQNLDQETEERNQISGVKMPIYPHLRTPQTAIPIAPIKIEPIVIPPIEIASVSPAVSSRKGEIR